MITKIKKAIQYLSVRCYELKISIKEFRRGSKLSSDAFESFYKNGMLVEVHSVEKGLGLKNTKPGHSSKPVTNLINKMFGYIGRGYADGVLRRDVYIEKKKTLSEKLAALQDSIQTEKEEQECADELDEEIRALTKQASEKTYIGGLTKECVDAFVSMVYLYDDQTMKIEFNCEDVIRRALEKYGA